MDQLTTVGHAYRFHKVRGYSSIPPLQGLWVDTHISELHLIFPRHISTDFLVPRWLHIIKYPETASQSSGSCAAPATWTLSREREEN